MTSLLSLSESAWLARESSRPRSGVKVGAAVLTDNDAVYMGCNVELEFRNGMHAEVAALSAMAVADPEARAEHVVIAAEVGHFSPCGGCLDWIFALGGPGCWVTFERQEGVAAVSFPASRYAPFYPSR